ncbi:1190_t:CDS:10 [Entrophospora sp. SA101]|nr:1190_t:CDS:10 [Entrophospora sp. SA101]
MSFDEQEWEDVEPIPQDDGPNPLAPINYDPDYSRIMDYFRAISRKEEYSERALKYYRQKILFALNSNLYDELEYVKNQILENPKNYQLWHHRHVIVEKLEDNSSEISFINEVQWVIKSFNLWDEELLYLDTLLDNDIRNNSAWNQRYFVLFHNPKEPSDDLISREINYAISKIKITPNNISPWNYVKGVIAKSNQEIDILESLCKELIEKENISPHALGCLVNIYERRAKLGFEKDKDEGIKYQLIYVEGTRPTAKDDLEKITNNLNNMFAEIVKETIKNRRRLPKTLYLFGGTGKFELNVNLGAYRLNEINNANLPRKFSEMKDFVYFYECVMKWALLIRNVIESFDTARSGQRPSRLSYVDDLFQLDK